jgi:regulatory protein
MGYIRKKTLQYAMQDIAWYIQKMESFCAFRERCSNEIVSKLKELGADKDKTEIVTAHLLENNFFDDARFAHAFARGKHRLKKWGKEKIIRELKIRQINNDFIQEAVKDIEADRYDEVLYTLLQKKSDALTRTNKENIKQKLINFAYQKGYSYSDIEKTLQLLLNQNG